MPLTSEQVLAVVRQRGPIIPNDIRKALEQPDSTLISVYLSDLTQKGTLRRTNVKLGSSSFYYTPEQRPKVAELAKHLNEKERRVAERLRTEGVLRPVQEEPLTRVCLKNTPDFAIPIQVKTGQEEETFYRWFLLPSEEAGQRIRAMLGKTKPEPAAPETKPQPKVAAKPVEKPKPQPKMPKGAAQQHLPQEVTAQSAFGKRLLDYFSKRGIHVEEFNEVRKDSDVECVVRMPTPVGDITYFCKARSKKRSSDGDLAAAILAAKRRMLPALYVTTGQVTQKAKKAKELQEITVVEIGSRN